MASRLLLLITALSCLPAVASGIEKDPLKYIEAARAKMDDQRKRGLKSFKINVLAESIRTPGMGAEEKIAQFEYSWTAPDKKNLDLDEVPDAWKKTIKDLFKDSWRQISGCLLFEIFPIAKELKLASRKREVVITGKLPVWGPIEVVFEKKRQLIKSFTFTKHEYGVAYRFSRAKDKFRIRETELRHKGKKVWTMHYGNFKKIGAYELPTRVTLGIGEGFEFILRYTSIDGKPAKPEPLDDETVKKAAKAFCQDWPRWTEKERIAQMKILSEMNHDLVSTVIARRGLNDPSLEVRKTAATRLALMRRRNVIDPLGKALDASAEEISLYQRICFALGAIGDAKAVPYLAKNWWKHSEAKWAGYVHRLQALSKIRHKSSVEAMIKFLKTCNEWQVKFYGPIVINSLKALTGEDLGNEALAWTRWWGKNRKTYQFFDDKNPPR